jgi:hypothetical protein
MQAVGGEPLAELRAKPLVRSDTDDNCRSHSSLPFPLMLIVFYMTIIIISMTGLLHHAPFTRI